MDDLIRLAQATTRVPSTAATPEQVDLVIGLTTLTRLLTTHNQRLMSGEPVAWDELADHLAVAAGWCRQQIT